MSLRIDRVDTGFLLNEEAFVHLTAHLNSGLCTTCQEIRELAHRFAAEPNLEGVEYDPTRR